MGYLEDKIGSCVLAWEMILRTSAAILLILLYCRGAFALEPDEILVIANKDIAESEQIARYYCRQRGVPQKNIFSLPLGASLKDTISRKDYEEKLAKPIRIAFFKDKLIGKIKCLLTVYGVPIKVGKRGPLAGKESELQELQLQVDKKKKRLEQLKENNQTNSRAYKLGQSELAKLQPKIDRIEGKETNASVDSELSMVLFIDYDLYRWQPNFLKTGAKGPGFATLMVSRLDGANYGIAKGLVDKAIATEKKGLKGIAYIDSRGIKSRNTYGHYDQSLRNLAAFTRSETRITIREERSAKLFSPGTCPQAALYCGWYSAKKYVDAFDFVDGAIGYHIASYEAISLRDPNSSQWCPSMLMDGITATLGPVAEPYLHAFPEPRAFFPKLYEGNCLVEAYYSTKPLNSWQLVLIGDPLYRPFKEPPFK